MTHTHRYLDREKSIYDLIDAQEIGPAKMERAAAAVAAIPTLDDLAAYDQAVGDFNDYKSDETSPVGITIEEVEALMGLLANKRTELEQEQSIADQLAAMNAAVSKNKKPPELEAEGR